MADSLKPRRHGGGKPLIELAGRRFGTMLVVDRAEKPETRSFTLKMEAWWQCRCESCGAGRVMPSTQVRAGVWRCPCVSAAVTAEPPPRPPCRSDPAKAADYAAAPATFSNPAFPGCRGANPGR